jgi:hypothetical protein
MVHINFLLLKIAEYMKKLKSKMIGIFINS